jgi:hypothetical protein
MAQWLTFSLKISRLSRRNLSRKARAKLIRNEAITSSPSRDIRRSIVRRGVMSLDEWGVNYVNDDPGVLEFSERFKTHSAPIFFYNKSTIRAIDLFTIHDISA